MRRSERVPVLRQDAVVAPPEQAHRTRQQRERRILVLTLFLTLFYYAYSFLSDGFYQHDEAAHFLSMQHFWHEPNSALSNWAKPGYKLLFALPALLGPTAVLLFNCLIAALCCYLAYKVADLAGCREPFYALVLLAFQPFWLQLSFRNYAEPVTALLLLLALYLHYKDRTLFAALALSYITMIRQEFYPIVLLYGLYLLYKKQLLPALALLVFPTANHVWGWIATGDPLYLLHHIVGFGEKLQGAYPRQGFDHYFVMSLTIFGAMALVLFLVYLAQTVLRQQRIHLFILIPLAVYFLAHCVFNLEAIKIGPSTGGNLRYMIVIAPLMAVLGALAADRVPDMSKASRRKLFYMLTPFMLAAAVFLKYKHNNVGLLDEIDYIPVLLTLLVVLSVYLPLRKEHFLAFVLVGSVLFTLLTVKPLERSDEDIAMEKVVEWARDQTLHELPVLANHSLFYYFYGMSRYDFPEGATTITRQSIESARAGTVILWDSHYSNRPMLNPDHVHHTYFTERPEQFKQVLPPITTGSRGFLLLVFQKIAE